MLGVSVSFIYFIIGFIYFLPTYFAWRRKNRYTIPIFIINLFFGWSIIGWVGALVWAFMHEEQPHRSGFFLIVLLIFMGFTVEQLEKTHHPTTPVHTSSITKPEINEVGYFSIHSPHQLVVLKKDQNILFNENNEKHLLCSFQKENENISEYYCEGTPYYIFVSNKRIESWLCMLGNGFSTKECVFGNSWAVYSIKEKE